MKILRFTIRLLLVALLLIASSLWSLKGSTGSSRSGNGSQAEKTAASDEQGQAIKVHVNEVIVPVTIVDSQGGMILDLTKEKFHVFDNGAEQTIEHFDIGGEPLAVALVIETSPHIQMMAPAVR